MGAVSLSGLAFRIVTNVSPALAGPLPAAYPLWPAWAGPIPSAHISELLVMATAPEAADPALRLAEQLQSLSQVAETLTYRLLDLEERLNAQEACSLERLQAESSAAAHQAEETELRLLETEDRLERLEILLGGEEARSNAAPPARLQVVPAAMSSPSAAKPDTARPEAASGDQVVIITSDPFPPDPFPEEEEQAFMDDEVPLAQQTA